MHSNCSNIFSSVQFSWSVMCDSWWPHGLHHARPPWPSPTSSVYSNSCPLSCSCYKLSHPLSSPSPPTFKLSQHQGLFKWVSFSHQVAKVLEFQLQHPSNEYSGLMIKDGLVGSPCSPRNSFKSFLQNHRSKILWHSAFFIVQFSHPYMTTGKTVALTRLTFVDKVMSLLLICCLIWS